MAPLSPQGKGKVVISILSDTTATYNPASMDSPQPLQAILFEESLET